MRKPSGEVYRLKVFDAIDLPIDFGEPGSLILGQWKQVNHRVGNITGRREILHTNGVTMFGSLNSRLEVLARSGKFQRHVFLPELRCDS